ncbi:hypothetical protein ACQP2F_15650 [Actinoplanes sp. CA-030573]|uniref:hypothetical protein n=1 Tax=Actinoplanes sp. CA-030573 TaxID=3239898 RepID=UPI003D8B193B
MAQGPRPGPRRRRLLIVPAAVLTVLGGLAVINMTGRTDRLQILAMSAVELNPTFHDVIGDCIEFMKPRHEERQALSFLP